MGQISHPARGLKGADRLRSFIGDTGIQRYVEGCSAAVSYKDVL